jgi:hypothetical protein
MSSRKIIVDEQGEYYKFKYSLNKTNKLAKQFNFVCSALENQSERQFLYRGFELSPNNKKSNYFTDELFCNDDWHYGKWHIGYLCKDYNKNIKKYVYCIQKISNSQEYIKYEVVQQTIGQFTGKYLGEIPIFEDDVICFADENSSFTGTVKYGEYINSYDNPCLSHIGFYLSFYIALAEELPKDLCYWIYKNNFIVKILCTCFDEEPYFTYDMIKKGEIKNY